MNTFWTMVEPFTNARWWFGPPALITGLLVLLLCGAAALHLHRRSNIAIITSVLFLSSAAILLLPGVIVSLWPATAFGIDIQAINRIPTATFPAIGQSLDQIVRMAYVGNGLLLVGSLGVFGVIGTRTTATCPTCSREMHPSWNNTCPECQLMAPGEDETPLMRLGDHSASGVPITQFGNPVHTELLEGSINDNSWLEVIEGPSGVGERFAIGTRLTIGRDPNECRLVLDDESVSSRHAYIERDQKAFVIYDWGSRNGTFVNGTFVAHQPLKDGDTVQIGRITIRFTTSEQFVDETPTLMDDQVLAGARLVALGGALDGSIFPITRLDIHFGRAQHNDIVINTPNISRHHASVRFDGSNYYLLDSNAPNGTWVDDVRVLGKTCLQPGHIIRLGEQQFRFELEEASHVVNN
ncbi:MAG: FHA domain-containing protein [Chloroflexota bacterium]